LAIAPPIQEGRPQGRTPPHSLEAEQSVLGAILLDPDAITRVSEFLRPDDFYRENHAQIYRCALNLFADGEPIDNVTVAAELEKASVLERIGGRAHLALLEQSVPTAANVEYYGRIVKEKASKRRLITAGGHIAALGHEEALEADDALNQAQSMVFAIAEDRTTADFERLDGLLRSTMDRIDAQMNSGRGVVGIPSGFYDLDAITNGFKPSDLIIVAGRPAMGKTSMALNIALRAAVEEKIGVAIFSLEMSKDQLVERMLCEHARIDAQRMHRAQLSDAEFERLANSLGPLGQAPIFIDDSASLDELTLLTKARRIKVRESIGMVVVDYLQLMHGRSRGDDSNRVQEVSAISRALKSLARELRIPVIAISQLSRAPEQRPDKRPMLSDLRESGSIEQDSDLVMFVFRPDYYKPEDKPGLAEIIIAKHRNGPTGSIELRFRKELTRFENLEKRRPEPMAAAPPPIHPRPPMDMPPPDGHT
jgi:replicative DNA helicase